MNKRQFICVALLWTACCGFAQQNYQPACVMTLDDGEVCGLIDFRLVRQNQESCHFKAAGQSAVVAYTPEDIVGYRFTSSGKYYVAKDIEIEGIQKRVFVEFMVEGMMNLYYYEHADGLQYFFFEDENGKLFSVTRHKDKLKDYQMKKDTKYDGIIRYQFREYFPIAHYPEKIEFDQKSMIDIVKTYHDAVCTTGEGCIIYENLQPDKKGVEFNFSVYAGMEYLMFIYGDGNPSMGRPVMTLGCDFDLAYPQLVNHLSFYVDVSVGKLDHVFGMAVYRQEGDDFARYDRMTFDAYPFSFRTGFKYAYPVKRFSPMVKLGFSYKYMGGVFEVHKYKGPDGIEDFSGQYNRHYFGVHVAIGSDYGFKNGHAVFLQLFADPYINRKYDPQLPALSDAFFSCGVKGGYTF